MEFLKHLKNIYNNKDLENVYLVCGLTNYDLPQKSNGIVFNNNMYLSVQGSFGHYCTPRKTLPYDKYTRMEFALVDASDNFKDVKDYLDTTEYDEYFDGSVYGYVPIEMIEKLYQVLKNKFGLKE